MRNLGHKAVYFNYARDLFKIYVADDRKVNQDKK